MHKSIILTAITLLSLGLAAQAADGVETATFASANGSQHTFAAQGLQIRPADDCLIVTNADGTQVTLSLDEPLTLSFGSSSAIKIATEATTAVKIYSLQGLYLGSFASAKSACSALARGVYVMQGKSSTSKLVVR